MTAAPFATLDPDAVLDAVEACGLVPDGRLLALNSYENRVWQVGLEEQSPVIAKFYRPGRWSPTAIMEEHQFSTELAAAELPVVAPLCLQGHTLHSLDGFHYSLSPRRSGRAPALEAASTLEWLGRLIARMHSIGARSSFQQRGQIDLETFVIQPGHAVLASPLLAEHLRPAYRAAWQRLCSILSQQWDACGPWRSIRLHGDCHPGNVLWTDAGPHFVDFDDCRNGPAIQDLWMLATDPASMQQLLAGYAQFADPPLEQLALIPVLRAMRQVHHAGWIASRWNDPAFPQAFAFAAETRWWQQHIDDLNELAEHL